MPLPRLPPEIWDLICRWEAIISTREVIKGIFSTLETGLNIKIDSSSWKNLLLFLPDCDLEKLIVTQTNLLGDVNLTLKKRLLFFLYDEEPVCLDCIAIAPEKCEMH